MFFSDYVVTSPNLAMGGIGDTVRKNKNCARLTLAAQADKLGSVDELPVETDTEMLFLSKLSNRE